MLSRIQSLLVVRAIKRTYLADKLPSHHTEMTMVRISPFKHHLIVKLLLAALCQPGKSKS